MDNDIDITQLKKVHDTRSEGKKKIYENIYAQCVSKIKMVNSRFYIKQCTFHVPPMMWGSALYKMTDCVAYILYRLKRKGLHAVFIEPNKIFVSWENIVEIKTSVENLAEKDYKKANPNEPELDEDARWDQELINKKNEKEKEKSINRPTIVDHTPSQLFLPPPSNHHTPYLEYHNNYHNNERSDYRRIRESHRNRRQNKAREIERIISLKNQRALEELDYDDDKTHKKILQITT